MSDQFLNDPPLICHAFEEGKEQGRREGMEAAVKIKPPKPSAIDAESSAYVIGYCEGVNAKNSAIREEITNQANGHGHIELNDNT